MKNEKEQVLLIGVRKYDSFQDRQGNTVNAGCSVTFGSAYPSGNDNKVGFEVRNYTFRDNIDAMFNKLKYCKIPSIVSIDYHRESAFSNNIIIDDINPLEEDLF